MKEILADWNQFINLLSKHSLFLSNDANRQPEKRSGFICLFGFAFCLARGASARFQAAYGRVRMAPRQPEIICPARPAPSPPRATPPAPCFAFPAIRFLPRCLPRCPRRCSRTIRRFAQSRCGWQSPSPCRC